MDSPTKTFTFGATGKADEDSGFKGTLTPDEYVLSEGEPFGDELTENDEEHLWGKVLRVTVTIEVMDSLPTPGAQP